VQEMRRVYPFFPVAAARTRVEFDWGSYHFPKGVRVLLDLYGTNHDPRAWERPEQFDPDRFAHWNHSAFNFIPQGGGDPRQGHRCPGETVTVELTKMAVRFLTTHMRYEVPPQNLRYSLSRIPSVPHSRFVIADVRALP